MGTIDELIAYVVIGSGAEVRPKMAEVSNLHFAASRLGFAKLKVSPDQVIVRFTTEIIDTGSDHEVKIFGSITLL